MTQDNAAGRGDTRAPAGNPSPAALERLRASTITNLAFVAQTGAQVLASGPALLCGGAISNSNATRDELHIFDGRDNGGENAGIIGVLGNAGAVWLDGDDGVYITSGITVTQTNGTLAGALWAKLG